MRKKIIVQILKNFIGTNGGSILLRDVENAAGKVDEMLPLVDVKKIEEIIRRWMNLYLTKADLDNRIEAIKGMMEQITQLTRTGTIMAKESVLFDDMYSVDPCDYCSHLIKDWRVFKPACAVHFQRLIKCSDFKGEINANTKTIK